MAVPCCGSSQGRWALKTFPLPHRRERSKVPYIVRQCVEEIERRGMEEVGIYRVSGVATDIQALKAAFDVSECLPGKYGIGVWARCWLSGCPPWPVPVISLSTLSLHLLFYHILNERQRELWEEVLQKPVPDPCNCAWFMLHWIRASPVGQTCLFAGPSPALPGLAKRCQLGSLQFDQW